MMPINELLSYLSDIWSMQYLLLIGIAIVLSALLVRITHGMIRFTVIMLAMFLIILLAGAVFYVSGSPEMAKIINAIAVLVLGMLLIRQLGLLVFRRIVPKIGLQPPRILEELIILLAYVAWVLIRLSYAGLNPSSLVASTAAVTAVLAFAMQDTLGNILAGLALQLDHSVRMGDWLEADDIRGQVIQVQWRHTAILTLYGERVLVPNSHLMKTRVTIVGSGVVTKRIRTVYFYSDFSVSSTAIIPAIEQAINNARITGVSETDAGFCLIDDFTDGVVRYTFRYWLTDPQIPGITDSRVRQHIHAVFQRNGWYMAAPRRSVNLVSRKNYRDHLQKSYEHDQTHIIDMLKNISLFSPLNAQELSYLASNLKTLPYVMGSTIALQGELGRSLFIIISGSVDIYLHKNSHRYRVAQLESGQIIGEMSLLTGDPRRATVIAATDVVCYELKKEEFEIILAQRPELAEYFADLLAKRSLELQATSDKNLVNNEQKEKDAILRRIKRWFA